MLLQASSWQREFVHDAVDVVVYEAGAISVATACVLVEVQIGSTFAAEEITIFIIPVAVDVIAVVVGVSKVVNVAAVVSIAVVVDVGTLSIPKDTADNE